MSLTALFMTQRALVGTSCLYENTLHAALNWLDWRYWARIWLLLVIDVILVAVSLVEAWEDEVARIYLLLAIVLQTIVLICCIAFTIESIRERRSLRNEFNKEDPEAKGYILASSVKAIIMKYPYGSFNKIRRSRAQRNIVRLEDGSYDRVETIDFTTLTLARRYPRKHIFMLVTEFVADFLAFTSSLIVFRNGISPDGLAVTQGLVSVADLTFLVHSVFSLYLSKYRIRGLVCSVFMNCCYCCVIFGLFVVSMAGFAVSIAIADFIAQRRSQSNDPNATIPVIDVVNSAGFWTGWVLTIAVIIAFLSLAVLYCFLYHCGCAEYRGRSRLGKDVQDDVEILETTSQDKPNEKHNIFDEELSPNVRAIQEARSAKRIVDKFQNASIVTIATTVASAAVPGALTPYVEAAKDTVEAAKRANPKAVRLLEKGKEVASGAIQSKLFQTLDTAAKALDANKKSPV